MFKKLIANKKAQQTAEYALLIALVVAAVIAMQTYAQRTIQARIRDASTYFVNQTSGIGNSAQYEPYYLTTQYDVTRDSDEGKILGVNKVSIDSRDNRLRAKGGFQESAYNNLKFGTLNNGI